MTARRAVLPLVLAAAIAAYALLWQQLNQERTAFLETVTADYTLPPEFTGPLSLEFKGIVSDFLFLKLINNFGERLIREKPFTKGDVDYLEASLRTITDLDPYFWDAYLFGDMMLTWDFKRYQAAIDLLLKAREHRTWDYRVPYYIGFNYFYFLKDFQKGSKYLMEAARLPGAPFYLGALAARLSVYALEHKTAIIFLKTMLQDTADPKVREHLKLRIRALEILEGLEEAVKAYHDKFDAFPPSLQTLVEQGFIDKIPEDPYGGEFMLLKNGRVYTTSKLVRGKKEGEHEKGGMAE